MSEIKVNDGGGLFDKFGMVQEMQKKLEVLADAKGTLRCGLIWDMRGMLSALADGLKQEDEANTRKVEELKRMQEVK